MKNNYFTYLLVLLSATSIAQIHQLPSSTGSKVKPRPIFGKPAVPTSGEECFCFEFHTDPNAWLNAYDALINSQYEQFFAFQRDAIKEEIEQRLNVDFPNYEQAVKELFRSEATYGFENNYINNLSDPMPSQIEEALSIGQQSLDIAALFQQVRLNNASVNFEGLQYDGLLLDDMSVAQAINLQNNFGAESSVLWTELSDLSATFNTLGAINFNNHLANYLANQMYLHHKAYPDYQEIQQISAYLIYYANTNAPGPYNNTPGLFDDLDYYTDGAFDSLSNGIIDQLLSTHNVGSSYPDFEYNSNLDELKYIYATSSGNLGEIAYSVLEDFPSLIPVSADFMQSENYSSFSVHNVENILENFQSGDRLLPWAHTYGENISGQSLDRPDRIFYMQWDNDGISAGYNTISHLLEGLSNIPNNFDDGISIKSFIQQNVPGLGLPNDIDYGLLFDFDYTAGGISIEFSPYALEHIIGDLEHFDGAYGWDLFIDPFKVEALIALSNSGFVSFEDQVINNMTGKALCIYNMLKDNSTSFKNMIKKFDGEFPVSHLTFGINNNLPSDNYGITKPPTNFNTIIEMSNTQLANISDLGGAVAFVHEVIHAEIFRKMLSAAQLGNLDPVNMTQDEQVAYVLSLRENFPGIYDYYIDRYQPTWNHNLMAQHYLSTIADAIEEFDDFELNRQVYEDISWAGLRELEDLNNSIAWDNLEEQDKSRILQNLSNYFFDGANNCN